MHAIAHGLTSAQLLQANEVKDLVTLFKCLEIYLTIC
jgi:hypothetical protein